MGSGEDYIAIEFLVYLSIYYFTNINRYFSDILVLQHFNLFKPTNFVYGVKSTTYHTLQ